VALRGVLREVFGVVFRGCWGSVDEDVEGGV